MIFKKTNIINSLDCILAHSINFKDGRLKKGKIITKKDIHILTDSKIDEILGFTGLSSKFDEIFLFEYKNFHVLEIEKFSIRSSIFF